MTRGDQAVARGSLHQRPGAERAPRGCVRAGLGGRGHGPRGRVSPAAAGHVELEPGRGQVQGHRGAAAGQARPHFQLLLSSINQFHLTFII